MLIQRFALAGLASSAISIATMAVSRAELIVPPVAFAVVLAIARRSSVGSGVLFVGAMMMAWMAALLIGLFSARLQEVPPMGIWPWAVVLVSGSVLFVLAYCLAFRPYASEVFLVAVTPAAVVLASIGLGVNALVVTVLNLPNFIGSALLLLIWQTGVAAMIGLAERASSFASEEDSGREINEVSESRSRSS